MLPFLPPPTISASGPIPFTASFPRSDKGLKLSALLLVATVGAHAQGLAVLRTMPARNVLTAPVYAGIAVDFNEFLTDSLDASQALMVFSQQSGGKQGGNQGGGNTRGGSPEQHARAGSQSRKNDK